MPRIHVMGAAGAGTTTLARALAGRLRIPCFDSDDYYWVSTVPPYRIKREKPARDARIREDLTRFDDWVWSGSAVSWNHGCWERLTHCVYLTVPDAVRLPRLRRREEAEHAALPYVDEAEAAAEIEEFLAWAAQYADGDLEVRSRRLHETWLATLACPVIRIDGDTTTEERVAIVMDALA